MNGILIIDKPAGITSHDVVARVRRILKTKKVGHTGTLDPFATGVMVVVVGKATRMAQFLDKDEKEYEALVRFGFETDTGDVDGSRIADRGLRIDEIDQVLRATDWDEVFHTFRGEIHQIPPMYSAKKIDGKKLYEHARMGETVERKSITVSINKLELIESAIRDPRSAIDRLRISVACSAGTYIRTLAEDIGRAVGTGAHLEELRRTRAGRFEIWQSVTLDVLAESDDPASRLLPLEMAVSHLDAISLNEDRAAKTRGGLSTRIQDAEFADGQRLRMLDEGGSLLAIGVYDDAEKSVRPKVVLV
jgi:tRNA pseudouridine55 synthase